MVDPLRNFTLKIISTWLMKTSQNMSNQQLRLFIWCRASDHMAIEGHVASNDEHLDRDEEPNATTNKNDIECKIVHLVEARANAQDLLDFKKFFKVVASGVHLI